MPIYFFEKEKEKRTRKKRKTLSEVEKKRFTAKFNEVAKKFIGDELKGDPIGYRKTRNSDKKDY